MGTSVFEGQRNIIAPPKSCKEFTMAEGEDITLPDDTLRLQINVAGHYRLEYENGTQGTFYLLSCF